VLNANADQWRRVFEYTHRTFAKDLAETGLSGNDARWTSYSLSYQALVRCCQKRNMENHGYVYRACINAHRKYLLRSRRQWRWIPLDEMNEPVASDQTDTDLRLDLDEALARLDSLDAAICRGFLLEERTFRELGQILKIHESTVQRRFEIAMTVIRSVLRDYDKGVTLQKSSDISQDDALAA
jgi:hypothetical protein